MKNMCDFCPLYEICDDLQDESVGITGCSLEHYWDTLSEDDKKWLAFARDFPDLATTYSNYMAGQCNSEHIRQLYSKSDSFRNAVDGAKEKHSYFIEDMGLSV